MHKAMLTKEGEVSLRAGPQDLEVIYFEKTGSSGIVFQFKGLVAHLLGASNFTLVLRRLYCYGFSCCRIVSKELPLFIKCVSWSI